MSDERLFRLAIESIVVSCQRQPNGYWSATIRARRGDEQWAEAHSDHYELMTSGELLDVLDVSVPRLFGAD